MTAQELSQKYAVAIFSLALEKWLTALSVVKDKLAENPQLAAGLADSSRTFAERQTELDGIIPSDSDQTIRNFLYTLLENDDIAVLGDTITSLAQLSRGGPQVQVAYVTTALALSDDDQEQFRQKLRTQYSSNLEVTFRVDPTLIGGAVVQVGDQVIDGSVATRLQAMSNALGVKN